MPEEMLDPLIRYSCLLQSTELHPHTSAELGNLCLAKVTFQKDTQLPTDKVLSPLLAIVMMGHHTVH